jgi:RimJ/RimL family protein N-acetyltransferase
MELTDAILAGPTAPPCHATGHTDGGVPSHPDFAELRTERLVIRRFRRDDAPAFVAYRSDPDVGRYQSWDGYTFADAEQFTLEMERLHPGVPGEWFQFAVADPLSDELLGDVALRVNVNDVGRAELGFTFAPAHQGKGYATEAVRGVIAYAFDRLEVDTVYATTDARNDTSIALLERIGMRLARTEGARFKGEWCEEHTYELPRMRP